MRANGTIAGMARLLHITSLCTTIAVAIMWIGSVFVWVTWRSDGGNLTISLNRGTVLVASVNAFGYPTQWDVGFRRAWGMRLWPYSPVPWWWEIPLWMPVVVLAACTYLLYWGSRGGNAVGDCRTCGYDLTGNESGVCPECGTAIRPAGRT